jgi:Mg-chelatase subunit ChlD
VVTLHCSRRALAPSRPIGSALLLVAVLAAGLPAGASPRQAPPCESRLDKQAAPPRGVLGTPATLTLTVQARCGQEPLAIDVVLVVDNGVTMGGPRLEDLRQGVTAFIRTLDLGQSRVGLVSFSRRVELLSALTHDGEAVAQLTGRFFPREGSNLTMAVRAGQQLLDQGRAGASPGAMPVLLVVSNSPNDDGPDSVLAEAARVRQAGTVVAALAAGGDADLALLRAMASAPTLVFSEGMSSLYPAAFAQIAGELTRVRLTGARLVDVLPPNMRYRFGSGDPAPRVRGRELSWSYAIWPTGGITVTYDVECTELGRHPTNETATVELALDKGVPAVLTFPVPVIDCLAAPTATSPSTATAIPPTAVPTARPTVEAAPVYLPLALAGHCLPSPRRNDVVLVLDTSSSMLETVGGGPVKLELATHAAGALIDALALPADRAAVIAFSRQATLLQPLTGSREALYIAVSRLFGLVGAGTRLDTGLAAARQLLSEPARHPANRPVIIVLTDGLTDAADARREAATARAQGSLIYAIGLGRDVDAALLAELAGDPARYYPSPTGAELAAIYLAIAADTGCAAAGPR